MLSLIALLVAAPAQPRVLAADIDRLVGKKWTGTLTYRDYTTKKPVSIPTTLVVVRVKGMKDTWDSAISYPKEPDENSVINLILTEGGRKFNDETVVERTVLPGDAIRFVTEVKGKDDDRPAVLRYVHTIASKTYSHQKLVRLNGEPKFFERNVYRWSCP